MGRFWSMLKMIAPSVGALGLVGACAPFMRAVETPIPSRVYGDVAQAEEIFILLPGMHDRAGSFEERGFLTLAQEVLGGRDDAAFIAVDAHFGYYRERSIDRRLTEEVLGRFPGKKVTLVGISLGGFGALITARRNPELFDRVVLIAPFLGAPEHIKRLGQGAGSAPRDDMEGEVFAVWRWLEQGADGIPTTLLYGRGDKFRPAYDKLASAAPGIALHGIDGGHDWRTWNSLWADWLAGHVAEARAAADSRPRQSASLSSNAKP